MGCDVLNGPCHLKSAKKNTLRSEHALTCVLQLDALKCTTPYAILGHWKGVPP